MTKFTILSIFDKEKVKAYDHPDPANMIGTVSRGQGFLILNVAAPSIKQDFSPISKSYLECW